MEPSTELPGPDPISVEDGPSFPSFSYDPVHGYVPLTTREMVPAAEACEVEVVNHCWLQRLRQIHQLQTAWWVFPSAEHTRFQHVLGAMHLGGHVARQMYPSLRSSAHQVGESPPSAGYVELLMRMAGLLHDVGHGPFGHFFDAHFLSRYGVTHETLGAEIIRRELAPLLRRLRRTPHSQLGPDEQLDVEQVCWLMVRPSGDGDDVRQPRWLHWLRALLSGMYTIDNMDFVLRDAYFSGYSLRSFDLERLLQYSFFTPHGLTIHERGIDALIRFLGVRSELFRTVYFHRTVRGIDLQLADLFTASRDLLFPGNPLEHLPAYQRFTDHALLVDVAGWSDSEDPQRRSLAPDWQRLLRAQWRWIPICQRNIVFGESDNELASIFSDPEWVESKLRQQLPEECSDVELRVDIARHIHRPNTRGPAKNQNFLFDSSSGQIRPLTDNMLFRLLPISQRICRIYGSSLDKAALITAALDGLLGSSRIDDLTNM